MTQHYTHPLSPDWQVDSFFILSIVVCLVQYGCDDVV